MSTVELTLHPQQRAMLSASERTSLERRARRVAWAGNAWHFIEFTIAVSAGIAAGSVAVVAFGIDSLIEIAAAFVKSGPSRADGAHRGSPSAARNN